MVDLMIKCWDVDPNKRPDFKEISDTLDGLL
ncbi:MAG: hypothetical protein IPK55_13550 [Streptococcus sp.]|nr:hypothetical protein [Streptococcus sp.]